MLGATAPRHGHRYWQLTQAASLVRSWGRPGTLLDLGAGTCWLSAAWEGPAIAVDIELEPSAESPGVCRCLASADALPLDDATIDTVAGIAVLGAFDDDGVHRTIAELHRVLRPGGRVVLLVSVNQGVANSLAPHRVLHKWRWRSFDPDRLSAELRSAGFDVLHQQRGGGMSTVAADWLSYAFDASGRIDSRLPARLQPFAEIDRRAYDGNRANGRYLFLVAERAA